MTRTEALAIARGIVDGGGNHLMPHDREKTAEACTQALLDAVREEREQCAKVASEMYPDSRWHAFYTIAGAAISAAIQKGGNDGTQAS